MKLKSASAKKIQILPQTQINYFMQCATHPTTELVQHFYNFNKKINEMNLISANSRLTELRIKLSYDSLHYERVYSNIIYTNRIQIFSPWIKTSNNFIYRSQIYHILFTQNSNLNHRVQIFEVFEILQLAFTLDGR